MMRRFLNWLFGDYPQEELEGVDDPHDNADPQRVTYIYGGSVYDEGTWLE